MKLSKIQLESIYHRLEVIDQCSHCEDTQDIAYAEAECLFEYLTQIAPNNTHLEKNILLFQITYGMQDFTQMEQIFKHALAYCFE